MFHRILIRLTLLAALCVSITWAQPPHFDPRSFLDRMDQNKNGILERNEIDGRAEGFLRRMKPDINLDKGVSIDKVSKMMQKAREERERDREREHGRDGDRDRNEDNDQGSPLSEALVAGFGEEPLGLSPVINFGSTPENYIPIAQGDWDRARGVMEKYDRDKDGQLTKREREKTRWSDNPLMYDSNRDGKLSLGELATRYAYHHKRDSEKKSSSSSDDRGSSWRRGDRGSRGSRDEKKEQPGIEIISGDGQVRYLEPAERLPEGLPEWFGQKDLDGDGQLTMAEFIAELTPEEVAKFTSQDLDNDGILIAAELGVKPDKESRASQNNEDRSRGDRRNDDHPSRGSVATTSNPNVVSKPRGMTKIKGRKEVRRSTAGASSSSSTPAESSADVDEKYKKYAEGRVKQYDANRDGVLSIEECKAGKPGLVEADANADGKITPDEVARYYQRLYKR